MEHVDAASAIIPSEKLRDYLPSPTHPIGRYKAAFFASLGYLVDNWPGVLRGPNGREAANVAVWIVPVGQVVAHFVTASPED